MIRQNEPNLARVRSVARLANSPTSGYPSTWRKCAPSLTCHVLCYEFRDPRTIASASSRLLEWQTNDKMTDMASAPHNCNRQGSASLHRFPAPLLSPNRRKSYVSWRLCPKTHVKPQFREAVTCCCRNQLCMHTTFWAKASAAVSFYLTAALVRVHWAMGRPSRRHHDPDGSCATRRVSPPTFLPTVRSEVEQL